jgi:SAM-dependent methyltransferase
MASKNSIFALDHVQLAMPPGSETQARAFYQTILGLRETPKPEPLASRGGCWFESGEAFIHLGVEQNFIPARKAHPALLVKDLSQLLQDLQGAGVPVTLDDTLPGVQRFYAADPFGNRLEFIQDGDGFSQHPLTGSTAYEPEPPAQDEAEVRRRHAANRESWNQGAQHYRDELAESIAFLRDGKSNLHPIERANLGVPKNWCHTAIHLQCASGRDTLSLWNEGVQQVIGVDISDVHIANAREMSAALGAPATWYCCDILDTPHELDGTADLVYTGRGALYWLHDLQGWANVVARLLKPGGAMHLFEGHPMGWLFDQDAETLQVSSSGSYFDYCEASRGWSENYIGDLGLKPEQLAVKHECLWPLSSVFTALRQAGLTIEHFGEYRDDYWDSFPHLRAEEKKRIPLTFAMLARKGL